MGGTRRLGTGGPEVGPVAFGAMSFAGYYGAADAEEGVRAVHRAIDLGITLIDTAEAYGGGSNEELVGRAIAGRRDAVVLATKASRGAPGYLRDAAEASLRRLGVDHIDVYYLHRVDADVPIEESVGAMSRLVEEGRVRHIGLSEAGPARSAAPTRSTRSRPCRASGRSCTATPSGTSCRCCASSASPTSPTAPCRGGS